MNNNPNLDFYGFGDPPEQAPKTEGEAQAPGTAEVTPTEVQTEEQVAARTAQAKSAFSRLGFGVAALVVGWYATTLLLRFILPLIHPALAENQSVFMLLGTLPLYFVGIPLLYGIIRNQPREIPQRQSALPQLGIVFFIALFFLIVGAIVSNITMGILGTLRGEPYVNNLDSVLDLPIPLVFFLTVICAPIFEELICRKLLLERALPFGELPAILFTSAVFALIHGNFFQLLYAFLLGVVFSYVYLRTGKLRYTIALHMIINFIGGVLPAIIMQGLDVAELTRLLEEMSVSGDMREYLKYMLDNMGSLILEIYLLVLQYGGAFAGLVLLLVFRRRIAFNKRQDQLRPHQYGAMFLQPGGIVMLVVLCGLTLLSLFIS
ncbi:MAG: CPBP family intramembrane metalloprotease [Clostridia bacterium]|nr:CPBP family intramembrane metalloprotease [Clostridia bacterium]